MADPKDPLSDFTFPDDIQPIQPAIKPQAKPQAIFQESTSGPKSQTLEDFKFPDEIKSMQQSSIVPQAPKPYAGWVEKVKSTAGYGAPRAAINVGMTPFDVPSWLSKAGDVASSYILPQPKPREDRAPPSGIDPRLIEMGEVPWFRGMPTSETVKESIEPYLYAPKSPEAAHAASDIEAGLTYAVGSGKQKILPFLARFTIGTGSQEAAEDLSKTIPWAAAIPIAAMAGTEGIASLVKGLTNTDRIMADKIKAAYDLDVRNGVIDPSRVDPNTPVLEAAPQGSALRKLLTAESKQATIFPDELVDFNARAALPSTEKGAMLTREAGNMFGSAAGRPMGQSAELRDLVSVVDGKDIDRVYDIARNHPQSASIDPTIFGGVDQIPIVKNVEKTVQENISNISDPAKRAKYVIPDPTNNVNGNLAYWDEVYRQLRQNGRSLSRDPATLAAARNSSDAAGYVRDALDQHTTVNGVSLYKEARDQAHEHFGTTNSLETGNDFYTRTPRSAMDFQDDMVGFSKLSPDQKVLAKYGYLDSMYKDISQNGFSRIADNLADETTPLAQKTKLALSKPKLDANGNPTNELDFSDYDAIRGKIMKSAVEEKLKPVKLAEAPSEPSFFAKHPTLMKALPAAIPTAIGIGANALQNFAMLKGMLDPKWIAATAAGAAASAGVTLGVTARNAAMQKAANQVLLKLSTGNVRDLQGLSELTRTNPFAAAFYRQLNAALRAEQSPEVGAGGRAEGGRVARKEGGRISAQSAAESLMKAAESAKKGINKTTETILSQPDEHVAKALEIAKQHI